MRKKNRASALDPKPSNGHVAVLPPAPVTADPLKLDIGCGPRPLEGFVGCDLIEFPNVQYRFHAGRDTWPFADSSVDEARAIHFLEHLTNFEGKWERTWFFNELWRVLKPGAGCQLIMPHWCSNRYYGDPTHKEPFSEMGFYYLSREWRIKEAPHTDIEFNPHGYKCDLEATWGYALRADAQLRSQEVQQFWMSNYKEVCQDLVAMVKARK